MAASDSPSTPKGYKWKEISDLPSDLEPLRDRELESLSQVWADQKNAIEGEARIVAFNQELAREWAIETGIIEGVYTLDRGITETLIERGIDSSYISHDSTNRDPELVARIIQGHQAALEGLFAFVRGERELGTSYIRELHAALLQHQDTVVVFDQFGKAFETPLEKGAYKKHPNNPRREDGAIHEYSPPEHVTSEMDRLIELHRQHRSRWVAAHIEAAWLHHAFTQIHPFQDGNGRVARALASLVFIRAGRFPLVVTRDDRTSYIERLELADAGDLSPLVDLFAQLQKRALKKGIARAADAKPVSSIKDALAVTHGMLQSVGLVPNSITREILEHTDAVLRSVAAGLQDDIGRDAGFEFSGFGEQPKEGFMRSSTLFFRGAGHSGRIVVMQPIEGVFNGVLSVVADFVTDDNKMIPLHGEPFWVDYKKPAGVVLELYSKWLDDVMIRGLAEWRRTLV